MERQREAAKNTLAAVIEDRKHITADLVAMTKQRDDALERLDTITRMREIDLERNREYNEALEKERARQVAELSSAVDHWRNEASKANRERLQVMHQYDTAKGVVEEMTRQARDARTTISTMRHMVTVAVREAARGAALGLRADDPATDATADATQ